MRLRAGTPTTTRGSTKADSPWALIIFGSVFALAPLLLTTLPYIGQTASTSGEVISTYQADGTGSRGSKGCGITAQYVVDGQTYTAGSEVRSSSFCGKNPGEQVIVRYDPDNPADGDVALSPFSWFFVVFFLMGAGVFVGGLRMGARRRDWFSGIEPVRRAILWSPPRRTAQPSQDASGLLGPAAQAPTWMPTQTPPLAPGQASSSPGWHLTQDGRHWRWFDGANWTDHVRPVE